MDLERRVDAATRELADELARRIDALVEAMLERVLADPDLARFDEPHFQELARLIARENLLHEVHALRHDRALPESAPGEAQVAARQAVELDAPVTVVLRCYRAGHAVLWSAWLELVEHRDFDDAVRRRLLESGSEFMFAYVERCTAFVLAEYAGHHDAVARTRDYRRLQAVRRVLAGEPGGDALDGYPLAQEHLGLVAWGPDAKRALGAVAERAATAMTIPGGDGTLWAWIGGADHPLPSLPGAASIALGTPGSGVDGFRRTHREAQDARAVATRLRQDLTRFDEVSLEALALVAGGRAHELVERELATLAEDTARARRLRETLEAYFASGQNATAAGARLGVNERTVRNRLRAIEETIGRDLTTRRAEVETALRFARVLGPTAEPS
jgi:hypothetical protein